MKRELGDGYEVDDDVSRVDLDVLHRFLSEEAYWAKGRPRATVERLVREAARVVGLYHGDEMVGFCRVSSDGTAYAFLCDVFVLEDHRGRGLGVWLVQCVLEHPELKGLRRWALATADAHELYARFGFRPTSRPEVHLAIERTSEELWPPEGA